MLCPSAKREIQAKVYQERRPTQIVKDAMRFTKKDQPAQLAEQFLEPPNIKNYIGIVAVKAR